MSPIIEKTAILLGAQVIQNVRLDQVDRILQLSIGEFSRDRVERADALSRTGDPLQSASRDGLHAAAPTDYRTAGWRAGYFKGIKGIGNRRNSLTSS
jgi:hypothetical protein